MSHELNRESVQGTPVADYEAACAHGAGAFYFVEKGERLYLGMMLPGEDDPRELPIKQGEKIDRHWQWDGNREAPTLEPSIQAWHAGGDKLEEHWHGYLKAGRFESC